LAPLLALRAPAARIPRREAEMGRLMPLLLICCLLAACGGANTVPPEPPPAANQPAPAPNKAANMPRAANKPADPPKEKGPDPNLFKAVSRDDPPGWFRLTKEGQAEILGHTRLKAAKPANYDLVAGVSMTKEPGPTEGDKEWKEWGHNATAALLYFIDSKAIDPVEAIKQNAGKVAEGTPDPKKEGSVAWTALEGGKVALAALNADQGTYLVVGVILDSARLDEHTQTIVKWAQSVKTDIKAD
jgi:hypothetical protein